MPTASRTTRPAGCARSRLCSGNSGSGPERRWTSATSPRMAGKAACPRRRVGRWAADPLLLLDEPALDLDVLAERDVLRFTSTLNLERGTTVAGDQPRHGRFGDAGRQNRPGPPRCHRLRRRLRPATARSFRSPATRAEHAGLTACAVRRSVPAERRWTAPVRVRRLYDAGWRAGCPSIGLVRDPRRRGASRTH